MGKGTEAADKSLGWKDKKLQTEDLPHSRLDLGRGSVGAADVCMGEHLPPKRGLGASWAVAGSISWSAFKRVFVQGSISLVGLL